MATSIERRYLYADRAKIVLVDQIREFLKKGANKVYGEYHKSGGQSDDLGEEVAELEVFDVQTEGMIQLYTIIDDSVNGYALLISVVCCSHRESQKIKGMLEFLDELGFVSKHSCFEERPVGYKNFAGYLEDPYDAPRKKPFAQETNGK